jgi:hypothetical protein
MRRATRASAPCRYGCAAHIDQHDIDQSLGLAEASIVQAFSPSASTEASGFIATKATGVSPQASDGTPTTAASSTSSCWTSTASMSLG